LGTEIPRFSKDWVSGLSRDWILRWILSGIKIALKPQDKEENRGAIPQAKRKHGSSHLFPCKVDPLKRR
jgi:hypothetical protein